MEQLKHQASVSSEKETVLEFDYVASQLGILYQHVFKDLYLHFRLCAELRLISYDFQSHVFLPFVIIGFENLTKRAFPEDIDDFVTIDDRIGDGDPGISVFIGEILETVDSSLAHVEDFVPVNFLPLKTCQMLVLEFVGNFFVVDRFEGGKLLAYA